MSKLILNGLPPALHARLAQSNFDVGVLRPYLNGDRRPCMALNELQRDGSMKRKVRIVKNANASLRKDEWIELDKAVLLAARPRLRFVADVRGAGLVYSVSQGLGKMVLESESMSDSTEASMSMDALAEGLRDRPEFALTGLPLPIIHKGFHFSSRQVASSRNTSASSALDVTGAEQSGRRVGEMVEKLALGVGPAYNYGGYNLYGLTNFPNTLTQDFTDPTATAWTPKLFLTEVLSMKQKSVENFFFGPWVLFVSTDWDEYLDRDYSDAKGDNTLRQRVAEIDGLSSIRSLDYLPVGTVALVQMTSDCIRMVNALEPTTVQWDEKGGLAVNFLVMTVQVPQLRTDYNLRTGIVIGTIDE
jgi:hypothetical protein